MTNLLFSHEQLLHQRFLCTDLGQLYIAIPFEGLSSQIPSPAYGKSGLGRKPWFDIKGGIALQFLKHYLQLSDAMLIERINTDWSMQLFCGIQLLPTEKICDSNLPGWWRNYIGRHLDIAALQKSFAAHWKPYMEQTAIGMQDATCYESSVAYPTDIKLLWQGCHMVYVALQQMRRQLKMRRSRANYQRNKQLVDAYQKTRKKTRKAEKKLRKRLLKFLGSLIEQSDKLLATYKVHSLSAKQTKKYNTVKTLYSQQFERMYGNAAEVKDRIVSIAKPYIRPIIRGKETRPVEFGAKVNKLQVDGISFIEHLSFDAFNEGVRLKQGIALHHRLFGKCTHVSADAIYATNENRRYCTKTNITTNFIPKGKQKQQHVEQSLAIRQALNVARGTILEGSFGTEKEHYHLKKIPARNQVSETCWIFFGMMTANAVRMAKRITASQQKARAA
ncbi:MAG: transposase [Gallicola sp.]|nr:transposase [Gallicola sp.]